MKITFLGTGTSQGVPVIGCACEVCSSLDFKDKRLRTSVHLEVDGKSFVIDTGPDFRQQMLRERVTHLDAVFYTHAHKDHTAGLDDIRPFNFSQDMDMPVYGQSQVLDQIRAEFPYIFSSHKYPGVPMVKTHAISKQPFVAEGITFTPIEVFHHKLSVFAYRIRDFTYITDANYIPPAELKKIYGTKVLVINALQQTKHISHFNLEEALEMVRIIAPDKAYLTHISHKLGAYREVQQTLPENVYLSFDGLKITVE